MRLLITGGCGFIGSNFIHYIFNKYPNYQIINVDKLTYAGNLDSLKDIENSQNYKFIQADIADKGKLESIFSFNDPIDIIINFAAETHVDRSISNSDDFIKTNVVGTHNLLELARVTETSKFLQISTDEVYGELDRFGKFTEFSPIRPSSPYSASKAAADFLVLSYHKTYKMYTMVTRCSNNYGPFQYPEKFIPLLITNCLEDKPLPVYGKGENIRDWIHVSDHCRGLEEVMFYGESGQIYNIGGDCEKKNLNIAHIIASANNKSFNVIEFVRDRPGHDFRYAIDFSKMTEKFSWKPIISFEKGIKETILWYKKNQDWWRKLKNG